MYGIVKERLYRKKIDLASLITIFGMGAFSIFHSLTIAMFLANDGFEGVFGMALCGVQASNRGTFETNLIRVLRALALAASSASRSLAISC